MGSDHSPSVGFFGLARLRPAVWASTAGLLCFPDSWEDSHIGSEGGPPFHIARIEVVASHLYSPDFAVLQPTLESFESWQPLMLP